MFFNWLITIQQWLSKVYKPIDKQRLCYAGAIAPA